MTEPPRSLDPASPSASEGTSGSRKDVIRLSRRVERLELTLQQLERIDLGIGRIHVSAHVAELLEPRYRLERRGLTALKGKGSVETFFLEGRR